MLVDVRTPAEYSTGHLDGAINIEYESVDQLTKHRNVSKDDHITLYCRSGRRSAIAMNTLKTLGFKRVRDIGGFEEARDILLREKEEAGAGESSGAVQSQVDKESLEKSTKTLLDGLKAAE
ncbi:Rhodanese-like domain-containing protein [Cryomyces antarcticus]|uniref:Rhodanese domain-containing protein n=1 Tax=Cryomyces antarcticus TaxID=329879 RepID=A0ABR0M7J6_9PEZI|nr:hypothetical protein LTR60_001431 [Cryomyces antarcticus]KAK5162511.1 hypothetical protein LTR04_003557 [Oleoguttula sp. CCFEE 6159]KAK5291077.1 hypothetical protein LTR16_002326 [Cryomyces antarcticus]